MKKYGLFPVLLLGFIILFAVACERDQDGKDQSGKYNVVSTTGMINDIVVNVAGDLADTKVLMGPGVDPHLYKARASDVETLSDANIIFYNGLQLEGKIEHIFEKMKKQGITTVPVAESIDKTELLDSVDYPGSYDPHVWFDVILWKDAVRSVTDTLVKFDQQNGSVYRSNAELYLQKLDELHEYIVDKVSTVPEDKRVLITAHDAFNYFGKGYGFEVIGLQGLSTETEASTSDIREMADIIVAREIPAIFVETSVSPKSIQALRAAVRSKGYDVEVGGSLYSDAMGDAGTPEGTYMGMFKHNIDTISSALKGGGQ